MKHLHFRHSALAGLFFLLFLPQLCQANPIMIDPVDIGLTALLFLGFDALIDLLVVAAGFGLVREFCYFNSTDFIGYFICVVLGGLLIDLIAVIVTHEQLAFGLLLAALVVYNTFLCRSFFRLAFAKAVCIGLMVGIFTNPFLWSPALSFNSNSF